MRRFIIISLITAMTTTISCKSGNNKTSESNPFLGEYKTPYGIPPFDSIKPEHYIKAFNLGRAEHNENIQTIINNKEKPTFDNVILAMEHSSPILSKVSYVFYNIMSCNTNAEIQAIAKEQAPLNSAHYDAIKMNADLFAKVKAVYENRKNENLSAEQQVLLKEVYKGFVRSGALLNDTDKIELSKINQELSTLSLQFGDNVLAETNNFEMIVDSEIELDGLPQTNKDQAAAAAKAKGYDGKWLFTTQRSSVDPFLENAKNRKLRKNIYTAYIMRGNNDNEFDNKVIVEKIVNLRLKRANLLGYLNHATYILEENMAKNSENVYEKLNSIMEKSTKVAKEELADMQTVVDAEGGKFKIEGYDWAYYTGKVREQKFNLNSNDLKPYFELNNVVKSAFFTINKLFGLQFIELKDVPCPHPDATAYEVKEANGDFVGILYADYYARESKRGGAWMGSYRKQQIKDKEFVYPIITTCYNFSKPLEGDVALISLDEAQTIYHELGHALHGLLSKCTYESLSGTSVCRDFVELPSQILEHWVTQPEVMAIYANHYKTGEPMPEEMKEKLLASVKFNEGFRTTEFLAAAILDMDYHSVTRVMDTNINAFELKSNTDMKLIPEITNRYRSTYFSHIFSGGYSAGYYAYIWAAILDSDAFAAFKEKGIFNTEIATKFRQNILERGGSEDPMELYKMFRGSEPNEKYLLENRGLL